MNLLRQNTMKKSSPNRHHVLDKTDIQYWSGYCKLVLAEFDYNNQPMETFPFDQSKERWSMYMLKKEILPRMYWGQILTGKA